MSSFCPLRIWWNTDGRFVWISPVPTKQKNSVSLHFTLQKGIQTFVRNHCETKSKQNFFTGPEKGNIFLELFHATEKNHKFCYGSVQTKSKQYFALTRRKTGEILFQIISKKESELCCESLRNSRTKITLLYGKTVLLIQPLFFVWIWIQIRLSTSMQTRIWTLIRIQLLKFTNSVISVLPSANLVLENIGSVYPFYVYDGHRPLAPILHKTKKVQSAVWCLLTCVMMMFNGLKIPGIQSRIRTEYFLVNMKTKLRDQTNEIIEWNTEQSRTKDT